MSTDTYAIIQSGGSQYRVKAGQSLKVAKINKEKGESLQIEKVLAVVGGQTPLFGHPFVEGARVEAKVQRQARGPKILVFKKQRRKRHRRLQGHRQAFTELKIEKIVLPSEKASAPVDS